VNASKDLRKNREIVIVDYRPEWPEEFARIAAGLRGALGELALRIDHIGSTSVPGLSAKDIIDVQVTVAALTLDLDEPFAGVGCVRIALNDHDHVPPTATGVDQDWRKLMYRPPTEMRPTHIHIRRAGSANGRYALLFRDYLRTHLQASAAYAQVKAALARNDSYDWDLYYDIKDPVCDIIMAGAEDWAAQTGWRTEHYA
jgi:GrpB-like predicted nucleotidyltransferase (UPF0157 family)